MKKIALIIAFGTLAASCQNSGTAEAKQRELDSLKLEVAKQKVVDSMNRIAAEAEAAERDAEMSKQATVAAAPTTTKRNRSSSQGSSGGVTYNTTNNYSNPPAAASTNTQQPAGKKRWSSKATGTLIGAGAGALGGALISDQKGKGAIIGGVSGAAVGLGTGAIIDNERKKKEERQRQEQQQQQ